MKRQTNTSLVLETRGRPYTTAKIISEFAGVEYRTITRLLRERKEDFENFGKVGFEITPLLGSKTGQKIENYHLNEQQATLLMTYLKNTEQVRAFKKELVRQFYAMRSLLTERASPIWQDTRSLGKEVRRVEAEAIKAFVEYSGDTHAYINFSKLANKAAGVTDRDKAQVVDLTALLMVEKIIAQVIDEGMRAGKGGKDIYQTAKERLQAFRTAVKG